MQRHTQLIQKIISEYFTVIAQEDPKILRQIKTYNKLLNGPIISLKVRVRTIIKNKNIKTKVY